MPSRPNNDDVKSPSVLVLTDPRIDVKGRFGKGTHLGYIEQKSEIGQEEPPPEDGDGVASSRLKTERRVLSIPMSSDRAYSQLREQKRMPVTSLDEVRRIAMEYSKRYGVPIMVSQNMGNNKYVDALACMEVGRIKVHIHPIMQYRDREYIEARILEAIEECRDFEKERAFGWQRG